ncbi:uncharacterized protein LOC111049850 [Nilaparvata lugens]|uniref:uncharacterized protein LOC111049850 n=1 Tax=Nilaparvata lugens TaxID=108931 RepID=UPI000B9857C1|nr:uncharacterized protein LOC111049850 [Nilaparvata lugens]
MLTANVFSENPTVTSNMDSNRNYLRRYSSRKETQFSNQSVMKAVEKFVEAVQEMDETILVPCRLMDLQVGDASDKTGLKGVDEKTDLYSLHSLVNCVKNELLWSGKDGRPAPEEDVTATTLPAPRTHVRRPSTVSIASTNSANSIISDTDSEAGNENDSGIEGESENLKPSYTQNVEKNFRRHLYGLHQALEQMTDAASYLTKRYQNDVGGAV